MICVTQVIPRYQVSACSISVHMRRLLGKHDYKVILKTLNNKKFAAWNFSRKGAKIVNSLTLRLRAFAWGFFSDFLHTRFLAKARLVAFTEKSLHEWGLVFPSPFYSPRVMIDFETLIDANQTLIQNKIERRQFSANRSECPGYWNSRSFASIRG